MTDEPRHRVRRGRMVGALRTAPRDHNARRRENARKGAAHANRKRKPVEMDWDAAIARLRAMLDGIEAK